MKVLKGKEYEEYTRNSEELLTEHLQELSNLYGDEEDMLYIYRAEIRGVYFIIGEFNGQWQGNQWMFRVQLNESGKFERVVGEVTAELIGFLEAAVEKFIEIEGDRTCYLAPDGATEVIFDKNGRIECKIVREENNLKD